jgi:NAD(P)-dependent dehydrogenase (short-subunit alcohol dehydrogenase family)
MQLELRDHVALVTGGASGIGAATARTLAAEGCRVVIADINGEGGAAVAAEIVKSGQYARAVELDVRDNGAIEVGVADIVAQNKRIDILVTAAGIIKSETLARSTMADWQALCDTNLTAVLACCRAVMPVMTRQRAGRIVNIASVAAHRGGGIIGNALYGMTKAGVIALTKGLARELAPHGVNVNVLAPALTDTPLVRDALTHEFRARIMARIPAGRLGAAQDMADLITFLVSARASFITGAVIDIDGGYLTS